MSKLRLAWAFLTGGPAKVLDYVLDRANDLVGGLPDAGKERPEGRLATAKRTLDALGSVSRLCPGGRKTAYGLAVQAFADVVAALSDPRLTQDGFAGVCDSFRVAYASWRAE